MPIRFAEIFRHSVPIYKFWNSRFCGVPGATYLFGCGLAGWILDRLNTLLLRGNIKAAGRNVMIQRGTTIRYPGKICLQDRVKIGRNVTLSGGPNGWLNVGKGTWIGQKCSLDFEGGLEIGEGCTLSEGVRIYTHDHGRNPRGEARLSPLKIGQRVWIASYVAILPTVNEIGDEAIIGAGAVLTKNVPPQTIIKGAYRKGLEENTSFSLCRDSLVRAPRIFGSENRSISG